MDKISQQIIKPCKTSLSSGLAWYKFDRSPPVSPFLWCQPKSAINWYISVEMYTSCGWMCYFSMSSCDCWYLHLKSSVFWKRTWTNKLRQTDPSVMSEFISFNNEVPVWKGRIFFTALHYCTPSNIIEQLKTQTSNQKVN